MPAPPAIPPFVDHCAELLAPLGAVRARRMFGGWGLDVDGLFIALIAGDRLYLKASADARPRFAAAGCEPLVFSSGAKTVTTGYWTAPAEALDSPALMAPWAGLALQAALAARAGKARQVAPQQAAPPAGQPLSRANMTPLPQWARKALQRCAKFAAMPDCRSLALRLMLPLLALLPLQPARAQTGDDAVLQARDALRKRDRPQLAAARMAVNSARHPLAPWVEYWELSNRLDSAQQPELDAFYARWPGTYVEDRLRNDWLLELGRRRDWATLRAEFPRFRMNDDREVTCYALLAQHLVGQDVRAAARGAWFAQRDSDDGCALMARTLYEARAFTADDVWQAARIAVEFNRPKAARAAATLINAATGQAMAELLDDPRRHLAGSAPATQRPPARQARHGKPSNARRAAPAVPPPAAGSVDGASAQQLALLALMRMAASDPEATAGLIDGTWSQRLPLTLTATAWAHTGKQAALKQSPQAADNARRAWRLWDAATKAGTPPPWGDDLLAWQVRAALRQPAGPASDGARWSLAARAIDAMSANEQRDAAWVYWNARATQALALPGVDGEAARAAARQALQALQGQTLQGQPAQQASGPLLGFYGQLATEDLGGRVTLPPAPLPLTAPERDAARSHPGLARALQLMALGLRNEGVREWNFSLRGMADRELLASAQLACERDVWDRCINTSDRTRVEVDIHQRFPTPFRDQLLLQARDTGLDPAVLYGLIRQESRFIVDARSGVGASGLMQVMPATAKWTARKIGIDFRPEMLADRDMNLRLGAAYFKRVLDDFGGSLALAAAAYNAGPGRPRRWREGGGTLEPAAWAETIPFNETRDYVKKVLSNSVYYALLLNASAATTPPTLKERLGPNIGPSLPAGAVSDRELPANNLP